MKNPFFSIILPTYNRQNSLKNCLKSVLQQSFKDFEIIIIDNNSSDNTINEIQKFSDERIKLILNEKNYERCYSRNKGIENASGEYLVFLDSDDFFEKNHLLNWYDFLNKNNYKNSLLICQKKINYKNEIKIDYPKGIDYNNPLNLIVFPVIPGQVCIKRTKLTLKFNNNYLIFEDTALWLQLSSKFNLVSTKFDSYIYTINEGNSVNFKTNNFGIIRYNSIKNFINDNEKIVKIIGLKIFKKELSISLFSSAKFYIATNKNNQAILFILKSLLIYPSTNQLKHKILLILKLILKIPITEYQN